MNSLKDPTPWQGLPDNFDVGDYEGFVYLIKNEKTGEMYIGKKFFWSHRRKKVKGKKRKTKIKLESNWKIYKSSSEDVQEAILREGMDAFTFHILSLHKTRADTNYTEIKELFFEDVLYKKMRNGKYEYLNKCIMNRYFRKKDA